MGCWIGRGILRAMKDAQRMYNYNASSQSWFVALQSKTPIAPAKAIEQFESMWNTAESGKPFGTDLEPCG